MLDKPSILRIGAQLNNIDLVDRALALPQPVPIVDPGPRGQFHAQANHHDVAVFVGAGVQFSLEFFQVKRGQRMSEGDDFHQLLAQRTFEVAVRAGSFNADMLARQIDRFVMLDLQVVVVYVPDGEAECAGLGRGEP